MPSEKKRGQRPSEDSTARVLSAAAAMFRPLAGLLLRHGVSSPEAESVLRAVYVEEAKELYGATGKRANFSLIALVTGLDRGEVGRILDGTSEAELKFAARRHRVNRVLAGWHSNRRFVNRKRQPLSLPVRGLKTEASFWSLAQRYAPGVYPGLILRELVRTGAVEERSDGTIHIKARRYQTAELSTKVVAELASRVRDLTDTILHNATQSDSPRLSRTVESAEIDPKFLPLVRKMLTDRVELMLSGVTTSLLSRRWRGSHSDKKSVRVGLTVFAHENSGGMDTDKKDAGNGKKPRSGYKRSKVSRTSVK
jgi:hypothetical protein